MIGILGITVFVILVVGATLAGAIQLAQIIQEKK